MGWRTIIVNTHSKLSYKNHHLIFRDSYRTEMIHLSEIDILLLETTDITITTMLLKELIDYKVLVIICDEKRMPLALINSLYARHDSSLQLKRQLEWDRQLSEELWTEIIYQKISNQSKFLKELKFFDKSDRLLDFRTELQILDPSNREGHAARTYFASLFGNQFSRQDNSDINAGLDYVYSLILSMFAREIVLNGCMTQFGLKHSNKFNDFNLACDFMEPFRVVIDSIVYENKERPFDLIKRSVLDIFTMTYRYKDQNMYLSNIISDYTKQLIKVLNDETERVPEFRI